MLNVNSELVSPGSPASSAGGASTGGGGGGGRRVSLANLVSAQIELKRNRESSFRTSSKRSFNRSFNVSLTRSNKSTKDDENEMGITSQLTSNQLAIMFIKSTQENMINDPKAIKDKKSSFSSSLWSLDNKENGSCSIVTRLAEAVLESENLFEFMKKAYHILNRTWLAILTTFVFMVFHLVMIVHGVKNLDNCPSEPKIPIYIFVTGSVGLLKSLHSAWNQINKPIENEYTSEAEAANMNEAGIIDPEETSLKRGSKFTDVLITLFLGVWFVFGNYWILGIYEPRYKHELYEPNVWCKRSLYQLALAHLVAYYGYALVVVLLTIVLTIFTQIPFLIMKFQDNQ